MQKGNCRVWVILSSLSLVFLSLPVLSQTQFEERWESSIINSYSPKTPPSGFLVLIGADSGDWWIGDTVSEFPECGETPHRAMISMVNGSKALTLRSENSNSECSDNIWITLQEFTEINLNPGLGIPITSETVISFDETGLLMNPRSRPDSCRVLPCGDTIHLSLQILPSGSQLTYILQRAPDAVPNTRHSFYREIFLDPDAGVYQRNLLSDLMTIPNFTASGAEVRLIQFGVHDHGWATLDNLVIGPGLISEPPEQEPPEQDPSPSDPDTFLDPFNFIADQAEALFPDKFPTGPETFSAQELGFSWFARFYPETGIYLALNVEESTIYTFGGPWPEPTEQGALQGILDQLGYVPPSDEENATPQHGGGTNPGNQSNSAEIVIDASKGSGGWWFPQAIDCDITQDHQGKGLTDFLKLEGFTVYESCRQEKIDIDDFREIELLIAVGSFTSWTDTESEKIVDFVRNGGKLMLVLDHTPDNSLSSRFGLEFRSTIVNEVRVMFEIHEITGDQTSDFNTMGVSGLVSSDSTIDVVARLSNEDYIDINNNTVQDDTDVSSPVLIGTMDFGEGKILFSGDVNIWQQIPELFENAISWFNLK